MSRDLLYQQEGEHFAQTATGCETLAAEELRALGAEELRGAVRGLHFRAEPRALYRIVYESRLAQRIITPLDRGRCHDADYLYRRARGLDWGRLLKPGQTFAIFANVSGSKLRDSRYVVQRVKDAVVDRLRDERGERPSVDTRDPDLWISAHVAHDVLTLGIDASGGSLHRRGYRKEGHEAPMQETTAAAVLAHTEWRGERPLVDPMCGSGTLLAEAWLRAAQIPAAYLRRHFGVMQLPDFDIVAWKQVKKGADSAIAPPPDGTVRGSDIDPGSVAAARANLDVLPHGERVAVQQMDFRDLPGYRDAVIVCNPPHGIRLKAGEDLGPFYKAFGDWLKFRCAGSTTYVYFGDRKLLKRIGLRPAWKVPLRNGGLDGRLARYDLY